MLLELTMFPTDKGESVSQYVAKILDIIDNSSLPYQLTPMGTIIEGEWDELMTLVKKCYDEMKSECNRISCNIKIDWRKGKKNQLKSKTASLERKLGKKLAI